MITEQIKFSYSMQQNLTETLYGISQKHSTYAFVGELNIAQSLIELLKFHKIKLPSRCFITEVNSRDNVCGVPVFNFQLKNERNKIDYIIDISLNNSELIYKNKTHLERLFDKKVHLKYSQYNRFPIKIPFIVNYSARFDLVERCNLRCKYCLWHSGERHLDGIMSLEMVQRILPQLKGHVNTLVLYNRGEPLLYKDLEKVIEMSKIVIPRVTFSTNGLLLTEKRSLSLAKAGLSDISISLDGLDNKTNLRNRGINVHEVLKNIKCFSDLTGLPVSLTAVVTKDNYKSCIDMVKLTKQIPTFKRLGVNLIVGANKFKSSLNAEFTEMEHHQFITEIKKEAKNYGVTINFGCFSQGNEIFGSPCNQLWNKMININKNGGLYPCSVLVDLEIGNVVEDGLLKAINSSKAIAFREDILNGRYSRICRDFCNYNILQPSRFENKIKDEWFI